MKIGDTVKITKCDECPKVVGKLGTIVQTVTEAEGGPCIEVKFGRGRPPLNRPTTFVIDHLELVKSAYVLAGEII